MVTTPILLLQDYTYNELDQAGETLTGSYDQNTPWLYLTYSEDFLRERRENSSWTTDLNAA